MHDLDLRSNAVPQPFDTRVHAFLTSSNFQTCVQIQSLLSIGAFGSYMAPSVSSELTLARQTLPHLAVDSKYQEDYNHFLQDWQLFLSCAGCDDTFCPFRPCIGELDRCWWGALGSRNFLSRMKSRYHSFRFETHSDTTEACGACNFQAVLATQNGLNFLQLR